MGSNTRTNNILKFKFGMSGNKLIQHNLRSNDLKSGPAYYKALIDLLYEIRRTCEPPGSRRIVLNTDIRIDGRMANERMLSYHKDITLESFLECSELDELNRLTRENIKRAMQALPKQEVKQCINWENATCKQIYNMLIEQH